MRVAQAPAAVTITPELLLQLRRPVEVELSADGARLAYTVSPVYREKGGVLEARLWVDGNAATEPGASDALPRFSPDGSRLAYASDRGHQGRMSLRLDGDVRNVCRSGGAGDAIPVHGRGTEHDHPDRV